MINVIVLLKLENGFPAPLSESTLWVTDIEMDRMSTITSWQYDAL